MLSGNKGQCHTDTHRTGQANAGRSWLKQLFAVRLANGPSDINSTDPQGLVVRVVALSSVFPQLYTLATNTPF